MTTPEEIAIEEFHQQLSISRIDLRLILFLHTQSSKPDFMQKYKLTDEQVERSLERMIVAGYSKYFVLTAQGRELARKIKKRILELEQYN